MKYIIYTLLIFSLLSCSSYVKVANTNHDEAQEAIESIKSEGLILLLPTEYTKEAALQERSHLSDQYQRQLDELIAKRNSQMTQWNELKNLYSFSDLYIIPDSLLTQLVEGDLASKRNLPKHKIYVRYEDYGGFEIMRDYRYIAAPFPSKIRPSRGAKLRDLFGTQSEEKSNTYFFTELNKKLMEYMYSVGLK